MLEGEKMKINNQAICHYGKATATVECNIDSSVKGGVGKLLSVTSRATETRVEYAGDSVKVYATLNCKVILYNSDGKLESYDYLSDFNTTVDCDASIAGSISDMWGICSVLDVDSNVRGDKIVVQTLVDVSVMGIQTTTCDCVTEVEEGILTKTVPVTTQMANAIRDTFTVDEDYDTGVTVDKVLFFDADAIITNSKVAEGRAIFSGDMTACVVYLSEGVVTTKNFNLPFTEEVSCLGMCDGDRLSAAVRVSSSKIILSGVEGNNVLCLQIELTVEGFYFRSQVTDVVLDMHSPYNRLKLTHCSMQYAETSGQIALSDKISGSAKLAEELPPASKVLSTVIARQVLTGSYMDDGQVTAEGLLACNVVYLDADNDIHSIMVELPYCMQFDGDGIDAEAKLFGTVMVGQLYSKIKRDSEIEVTAMLNIHLTISQSREMTCVSEYEKCEALVANKCGISIYICQAGDDWWEAAKALNAPIAELERQNVGCAIGEAGAQVFYYRELRQN